MNIRQEHYRLSKLGKQAVIDGWLHLECSAGERLVQLGHYQLVENRSRAALATLSRAVDFDKWNPFAHGLKACALWALGDEAAAMRSHNIGLELEDWRKLPEFN